MLISKLLIVCVSSFLSSSHFLFGPCTASLGATTMSSATTTATTTAAATGHDEGGVKHVDLSSGRFEAPSLATSGITDVEQRRAITLDAFWEAYGPQLRVRKEEVVPLSTNELAGITYSKFYQNIRGHKVWASDITVLSDNSGKIASANGNCLDSTHIPAALLDAASSPPLTREMALQQLKYEIERRFAREGKQTQPGGSESLSRAPLVWHRGQLTAGKEGVVALAYHFDGSWHEVGARGGPGIIFDAFSKCLCKYFAEVFHYCVI